jgi:hypothetical protein
VAVSINDYLIDQKGIDWQKAFESWLWLMPADFTLWLVNRLADCFVVLKDGAVHILDVGAGTFEKVAENRRDFENKIDEGENADNWLAIPIVDELVECGIKLKAGQCYGFKTLPILGGDYTADNFSPLAIADYLGAMGSIHEQIKDLPDGTEVDLKII